MTALDRDERHPGYWDSPWPVECGGNRRQKAARGRLDAGGAARAVTRNNGRWNVMVVERDPDEWFLQGTIAAFSGPAPYGWVERIDPETLEPAAASPSLPCGDHVWCGAVLAHADGSLYTVNGSYMHRLDPDCNVLAERELPIDQAHNGLLALFDGTLVTKDLRLEDQGASTITLLGPGNLELLAAPFELPEASMGRIAAHRDGESDWILVAGTEHLWRLHWDGRELRLDEDWRPRYREAGGPYGLAWDSCIAAGAVWSMDNGDIRAVREIFGTHPNGRFAPPPAGRLSWRLPAPWKGAQRLLRTSLEAGSDPVAIEPFGIPGGGIIAPPVFVPECALAIAWDSLNGGLAGVEWGDDGFTPVWQLPVRPSMQPVVFPESREIVINDFTEAGSDDLIVVDLATGALKSRAPTGSHVANGMFLTPGPERSVFYCTTGSVARVVWE